MQRKIGKSSWYLVWITHLLFLLVIDNAGFLYDQNSGRFLLFKTEAPCFVVYTANFVDESVIMGGQPMIQHNGIALEAQALPDAIHSDLKDQVILKAGQTFTSKTRYELVVK